MYGTLTDTCGPVFAKEAVEIARRKRFYANRCLLGLALLFIAVVFAMEYGALSSSDPQSRRRSARVGSELFMAVSVIQFAAVFVFVPVFTCAVIAGEREAHTLELLFTTTLSDRQIILGKLASRLLTMATLVLSGLPVMMLAVFLGGVDPESVWRATSVTLLATFFVGAHAIYFSTVTRSPVGALVRTYWWLGLTLIGIPFLVAIGGAEFLPRSMRISPNVVLAAFTWVNPIAFFAVVLEDTLLSRMTGISGWSVFPGGFVLPIVWAAFLIWRAMRRLRREPTAIRAPARLRAIAQRVTSFRPRWIILPRRPALKDDSNPLWVRARRAMVYDRDGYLGRIQLGGWWLAATILFLFAAFEPNDLDDEEVAMVFGAFAWGGVALLAVLLAGACLAGDRKRGWLDLLLVTPLSGQEIIDGTLLSIWEHVRRIVWLPVALALFFCLTQASSFHGALASIITATLFLSLAVLVGVGCSLAAGSVTAGLAAAFAIPIVVIAVTPMLIGLLEEDHAAALWPIAIGLFVVGLWWVRRRSHCGAVFCFLLGMHLLLVSGATFWTTDFRRDQYPVAAMHPGFLTIVMLDDNYNREFRPWPAFTVLACYWMALIVNFIVTRFWLIRHFDRLAGRYDPLPNGSTRVDAATSEIGRDMINPLADDSSQKVDEITTQSPT